MEVKNIEILSSTLHKSLKSIYSVIENKSLFAILEDFLFEFDKDVLKITASNLQTTLSIIINIKNESKFKIAVPAKIFIETLKNFANQQILLCFDCEKSVLKIKSKNGEYKIACESAENFPLVEVAEENEKIEIDSKVLINAIKNTIVVASNDTSKPVINSILFSFKDDKLTTVATDIHRLVKFEQPISNINKNFELLLPKKNIAILENILEPEKKLLLSFDKKYVKIVFDNIIYVSTLVVENFPDYERVIPKNNINKMIINRENLLWSLKRLECFTDSLTLQIKLFISNSKLQIIAEDINFENKAEEILDVFYSDDKDLTIAYNIKYLLEIIKNIEADEVIFLFSAINENKISNKASIIIPESEKGSNTLILIMPMML